MARKKGPKSKTTTRPPGRPSLYTEDLAAQICEQIACGQPLTKITAARGMPEYRTVLRWLEQHEPFRRMYARAREDQADTLADQIQAIADAPLMGETRTVKPDGSVEIKQGDMIEHRRLQVESRKWIAAKLKPRKYGDSTKLEVSGELGVKRVILQGPKPPGT